MNRTEAKQLIESPTLKAFIGGGTIQKFYNDEWNDIGGDYIDADHIAQYPDLYRIKPEPREFWAQLYPQEGLVGGLYDSKECAERHAGSNEIIKVRAVI